MSVKKGQILKSPALRRSEMLIFVELASRVEYLRNKRGWTQQTLAEEVGFSRSQLANIERGRGGTSLLMIVRLANTLKTTTDYLLGRKTRP